MAVAASGAHMQALARPKTAIGTHSSHTGVWVSCTRRASHSSESVAVPKPTTVMVRGWIESTSRPTRRESNSMTIGHRGAEQGGLRG